MNFYKHFIGDYQRKTAALSMVEHGAYRLLLDEFYATGEPLPLDRRALYRLVRADGSSERKAVDTILAKFWQETPQGWLNARALEEITEANTKSATNRDTALAREAARRAAREEHERAQEREHETSTKGSPRAGDQSHSHSHSRIENQPQRAGAKRGSRLPDGWRPSDAALTWAAKERAEVDISAATASFTDYWKAKAGKDGLSLDWDATWRNWIRKERVPNAVSRFPTRNDHSAAARTMFGHNETEAIDV